MRQHTEEKQLRTITDTIGGAIAIASNRIVCQLRRVFGCPWVQRVLFGNRLVWHARSWASAVDFEAASRHCFLRRYAQMQVKPMVFQCFYCAPGSCWDVSNVFLGCCLAPQLLRTSSKRVPIVAPYRSESTPTLRP